MIKYKINKDFEIAAIDTGFHGTKLIDVQGNFLQIPSMSVQLHKKYNSSDISLYMQREQSDDSIMYFVDGSNHGYILGSDALNLMKSSTLDSVSYSSRYNTKTYFTSDLFINELIGQVAYLLFNRDTVQYDKDSYDVILSMGLPAELSIEHDYVTAITQKIKNKTFALDIVINKKNKDKDYMKYIRHINISINGIFLVSQPFGALASILYTPQGSKNDKYNDILDNCIIIDGGYGTLDISQFINRQIVASSIKTYPSLGMQSAHQMLYNMLRNMNHNILIQDIREKINKSDFIIDKDTGGTYIFSNDYNEILEDKKSQLQALINNEFFNFANINNIIFAGGVGRIYYEFVKNKFKDKANNMILVKVPELNNPLESTIFSIVYGYRNIAINSLLTVDTNNRYKLEYEDIEVIETNED